MPADAGMANCLELTSNSTELAVGKLTATWTLMREDKKKRSGGTLFR